jgi:hypothetical protein
MTQKRHWLSGAVYGFLISFGALYLIGLFGEPVMMKGLNYNPLAFAQRFIFNSESMLSQGFSLFIALSVISGVIVSTIYSKVKNRS